MVSMQIKQNIFDPARASRTDGLALILTYTHILLFISVQIKILGPDFPADGQGATAWTRVLGRRPNRWWNTQAGADSSRKKEKEKEKKKGGGAKQMKEKGGKGGKSGEVKVWPEICLSQA